MDVMTNYWENWLDMKYFDFEFYICIHSWLFDYFIFYLIDVFISGCLLGISLYLTFS